MNELILAGSVVFIFGAVLLAYRLFGDTGLYAMTVTVTILANIEVLILVDAFKMEQTLGNVLFAATFLITDILSENTGKKAANRAVFLGIGASAFFALLTASWMLYVPADSDWAMPSIRAIFSTTPRLVLASMSVYAVSQLLDVWLYHKWWDFTDKRFGSHRKYLWLRNNGSTLISQFVNTVLFNLAAFAGMEGYTPALLTSIILAGYAIYVVTSFLDTPVVYLARMVHDKKAKAAL